MLFSVKNAMGGSRQLVGAGAKSGSFDTGPVSTSNGVVYAGSMSGRMYALNATTGAVLKDIVGQGSSNAGPAIDNNGVVYWGNGYARFGFGTPSTTFYAFSLNGK